MTFHRSPRDLCTRVKIDGRDLLALELPSALFKHLNLTLPLLFHHFHLHDLLLALCAEKHSLLFPPVQTSGFQHSKGTIFTFRLLCHLRFYCSRHDYTCQGLFMISAFPVHLFLLFTLRVSVFWVSSDAVESCRFPSKVSPFFFFLSFSSR